MKYAIIGSLVLHWVPHMEDRSDRTDAQADLSLGFGHSHFVGCVMLWLKYGSHLTLSKPLYWSQDGQSQQFLLPYGTTVVSPQNQQLTLTENLGLKKGVKLKVQ